MGLAPLFAPLIPTELKERCAPADLQKPSRHSRLSHNLKKFAPPCKLVWVVGFTGSGSKKHAETA